MASGTRELSTWDHWVARLRVTRCIFRMARRKGKPFIFIRQLGEDGKVAREFSSRYWRKDSDADIQACAERCLAAHQTGNWATKGVGSRVLSWEQVAESALFDLRRRVVREGSRKNPEGHLKKIAKLEGPVNADTLYRWAHERCPITQPSAFRNRIETLSHMDKAGDIPLKETIERLKSDRPSGAIKKEQERRTQEVKAIPTDEALQEWLDSLSGHIQWAFALMATYGLRPSEAWHAEGIDSAGWITIPGEGKTKTDRHFAPAIPSAWVDRYQLRENFEKYQQELSDRWPIRWADRSGVQVPVNNSQVSNAIYQEIREGRIEKLWVGDEWVRPYGLRHSYAIRCETSTDPDMINTPSEDFAKWLGHGIEVHKRVYLKFMSADREKAALQSRYASKENPTTEAGLSEEVLAKLAKLEQLEKLLAS